jgi:hypothetical protein
MHIGNTNKKRWLNFTLFQPHGNDLNHCAHDINQIKLPAFGFQHT